MRRRQMGGPTIVPVRRRPLRLAGAAVLLVVSCCVLAGGQAHAASVPPMPVGAPGGAFTVAGSCEKISLSPHVVHIGQAITGRVSVTGAPHCGAIPDVDWPEYIDNGLEGVGDFQDHEGTCNAQGTVCTMKQIAATSQWTQVCFEVFTTHPDSCDVFYVIAGEGFEVSGTVSGPGGAGVGGVTVEAFCPGGATTTTTSGGDGTYRLELSGGNCQIAVELAAGQLALGPRVRFVDVDRDVSGVDFRVSGGPCVGVAAGGAAGAEAQAGAAGAAADVAGARASRPAAPAEARSPAGRFPGAAAAGCTLKVTVTALEPLPVRVGLGVHSQPYPPAPYPVDFVAPKLGGRSNADRCESGCVDLMVTVTNPRTHAVVSGATISADLSGVVTNVTSGEQALCESNETGTLDRAVRDAGLRRAGECRGADGAVGT